MHLKHERVTNSGDLTSTPISTDASDADLMAHMAAGNPAAMEVLYDRYNRPVFSFAVRLMGNRDQAEEVLQEVFLRVWRKADGYTSTRGSLISWILNITHNAAIDELRKRQRRPKKVDAEDPIGLLSQIQDDTDSVEHIVQSLEQGRTVKLAMDELPEAQREVLELGYFQGMTQREIAEMLDQPLGTVKTRMRLALRKLKESVIIQTLDMT